MLGVCLKAPRTRLFQRFALVLERKMIIFIDIFHRSVQIESINLKRAAAEIETGDESVFLLARYVPAYLYL
jgi:hypothetical protein